MCQMMNGRADRSDVKDEVVGKGKFQHAIAEQGAVPDKPSKTQPSMNCAVPSEVQEKPQVQADMPTMPMKNQFVHSLHASPSSLLSIPRQVPVMNYDHVSMFHNRLQMERMSRLHQLEQMKQLEDANRMEQLKLMKQMELKQSSSKKMEQMKLILQSNQMELMKMEHMKKMCMNPQGTGSEAYLMNHQGMGTSMKLTNIHGMNNIHYANIPGMGNIQRMNQRPVDPKVSSQISTLDEDIAECEEQLLILGRLKALKEKCRSMGY